ncbi:hypothetical protein CsSME_00032290 [Camellia sinensis var. sinensis]
MWRLYHYRLLFGILEGFRDRVSKYPNYFRVVVEDDGGGRGWSSVGEVLGGRRWGGIAGGMKIAEKKLGVKKMKAIVGIKVGLKKKVGDSFCYVRV